MSMIEMNGARNWQKKRSLHLRVIRSRFFLLQGDIVNLLLLLLKKLKLRESHFN